MSSKESGPGVGVSKILGALSTNSALPKYEEKVSVSNKNPCEVKRSELGQWTNQLPQRASQHYGRDLFRHIACLICALPHLQ